ncbi:MAG: serine hydrolase domain-containing protein [Pseudomonadota bacterium]
MSRARRITVGLVSMLALALATPAFAQLVARGALAAALDADLPVIVAARDHTGAIDVQSNLGRGGADMLVDLGSITKTATAIAVLHLIEEEGLDTRATLGTVLPDVPPDKAGITLHQLLTHTAGIIETTGDDAEPLARSAFLTRVWASPLMYTPGSAHAYSNAGYSILAAIIELQSGLSFEDYLMDRVLGPRGLRRFGYSRVYKEVCSLRTNRHASTGFARLPIAAASWGGALPGWNLIGNGGAVATAEAFLTFWAAFLDGRIVSRDLVAEALTPHADEGNGATFYGYGLVVEPLPDGGVAYWHDGGNDLFSAEFRHIARSGVTLFSAGRDDAAFEAIERMTSRGHLLPEQ